MKNAALFLIFTLIFVIFCGCAGQQRQTISSIPDAEITPNEIETIEARLSGTIPRLDDENMWQRGLGILVGVVVVDRNGQMTQGGLSFFADFGNHTNTAISSELDINLRLIAEVINRASHLQGISIISISETGDNSINRDRALAIIFALMMYGVDPENINYEEVSDPAPAESGTSEPTDEPI
jgi:hypothetical protein